MQTLDVFVRGGGFSNKGDQAMGMVVKQELLKRLPYLNFWNRVTIEQAEQALRAGYLVSCGPLGKLRKGSILAYEALKSIQILRALYTDRISAFEITQLKMACAVLDIGGFAYGDVWGIQSARRALSWSNYCRETGKPYIALPQAWGPFTDTKLREIMRQIVANSSLVYARDKQSLRHLASLGSCDTKVKMAPDIVFCLAPKAPEYGINIITQLGLLNKKKNIVAIAPNMRVYERSSGVGYRNEYVQLLIGLARFCIDELGAGVILIPHERVDNSKAKPDDQFLCGMIKTALSDRPECVTLKVCDDPAETMSVLSCCGLVIGSRFHVLVLSLTVGVPVVALGWAHKYEELLSDVGLKNFVIKQEMRKYEDICSVVRKAWYDREMNSCKLAPIIIDIRAKLDVVFDEVADSISMARS